MSGPVRLSLVVERPAASIFTAMLRCCELTLEQFRMLEKCIQGLDPKDTNLREKKMLAHLDTRRLIHYGIANLWRLTGYGEAVVSGCRNCLKCP